ncbi:MAG: aminoglycoside phosphotransferase family protein, partial [Mycobacteriales bacterium]
GDAERAAELLERLLTHDCVQTLPPLRLRVDQWVDRAMGVTQDGGNVVSRRLVRKAADLAAALLADRQRSDGLHGDFFPDNIVLGDRAGWLAIDPHTSRGDPCFDAGTWCYAYGRGGAVEKNIPAFTTRLDLPHDRIRSWAGVVATLNLSERFVYGHASEAEQGSTLDFAESVLA